MSVHELHPDHLLDDVTYRALSALEREHVDRHLARCVACRFERAIRADFRALAALNTSQRIPTTEPAQGGHSPSRGHSCPCTNPACPWGATMHTR